MIALYDESLDLATKTLISNASIDLVSLCKRFDGLLT